MRPLKSEPSSIALLFHLNLKQDSRRQSKMLRSVTSLNSSVLTFEIMDTINARTLASLENSSLRPEIEGHVKNIIDA